MLWRKGVIKRVVRHIAQTPDEKTYVECLFIEQLKGMWTFFLVPTLQRGNENQRQESIRAVRS
jgi:hypothetical protein